MTLKQSLGRMCIHPAATLLSLFGLTALIPLLLSGCGANKALSNSVIGTLARAAPYKRGVPALVFVYTDG